VREPAYFDAVGIFVYLHSWMERVSDLRDFGLRSLEGLDRIALGHRGERVAERHLRRQGYRILARNFRAAGAEIDLVAMDGETLVFVEVKTRLSTETGMPEEAVNPHKQRHIRRAAEIYALGHRAHERAIRFDVVAIRQDASGRHLDLLRDAF
jgi:putative endonuclease